MLDDFVSKEALVIGAVFGGITLVLTFIAGLLGGIAFGTVLVRMFLFTLLLFLLGSGAGVLLEKMIPGIWGDMQNSAGAAEYSEGAGGSDGADSDVLGPSVDYVVDDDSYAPGRAAASYEETAAPSSSGKKTKRGHKVVGDYLIVDDKQFPNNPDDYAKAIRTMMHKDD